MHTRTTCLHRCFVHSYRTESSLACQHHLAQPHYFLINHRGRKTGAEAYALGRSTNTRGTDPVVYHDPAWRFGRDGINATNNIDTKGSRPGCCTHVMPYICAIIFQWQKFVQAHPLGNVEFPYSRDCFFQKKTTLLNV